MSLNKEELLFLPIGGTCEIGMNLNLYRYKGRWIIIDCGAGFAGPEFPGIDITVMNNNFIEQNAEDIEGIIITHIHEDHCGGLSNLLTSVNLNVYTTRFVIHFLKNKIEPAIYEKINFIELNEGGIFDIGPFKCELVSMVHSTPEMHAVAIHTDQGIIYHSGDWKLDADPVLGAPLDQEKIKDFAKKGVLALVCDSTNVFSPGYSGCERDIIEPMSKIFNEATQTVFVTLFASNVARIQTIWNATKSAGRKMLVLGRSLHSVIEAAKASGYLEDLVYYDKDSIADATKDRKNLVVLCTGCQGDALGATSKLATGAYRDFALESGDTFVFSSKIIPGNEKKIYAMINLMYQKDVNVITEQNAKVHVSGHPYREELKHLYSILKPQIAVPVHGEYIHLTEHVKLAKEECNIKDTVLVSNGDLISLSKENGAKKIKTIQTEALGIDGDYLYPVESRVLKMRRSMQNFGFIVVVVIYKENNTLLKKPSINCFGCFGDQETKIEMVNAVDKRLQNIKPKFDRDIITKNVRQTLKKFYNSSSYYKIPFIHVHIEFLSKNSKVNNKSHVSTKNNINHPNKKSVK